MQQGFRLFYYLGALGAVLLLPACSGGSDFVDMSTPSAMHTGKIKVKTQTMTETLSADKVDAARVAQVARNILRDNTGGAATLTIPYTEGREAPAKMLGMHYKVSFARQGVRNLTVDLVPVENRRVAGEAVVAYQALTASADKDCTRIPGAQGAENIQGFDGYEYGCETQAMKSKMVAHPGDLLGTGHEEQMEADSSRAGKMVEPYKAGTPNTKLDGMKASTVGQ